MPYSSFTMSVIFEGLEMFFGRHWQRRVFEAKRKK